MNVKPRWLLAGISCLSISLLIIAVGMEKIFDLEPCPLCVLQRLLYFVLSVVCALAVLHYRRLKVYALVATAISLTGFGVSARHVWLEQLPAHAKPACGPSLEYLVANLPVLDVLAKVLHGSADCAQVSFRMLGFSIAQYSLLFFSLISITLIFVLFTRLKPADK